MLLPGRSWVLRLDDRCGCDCVYDDGGDVKIADHKKDSDNTENFDPDDIL